MDRPTLWRERRFVVSSVSVVLVVVGIAISAWALANIVAGSWRGTVSTTSARTSIRASRDALIDWLVSSTPTGSADATSTAGSQQVVYPHDPATGEILGTLTIPALKQSFPVIEGTGAKELKRGVGHLVQTAMPGEPDNCVISGHRDTVFSGLGALKKGDVFVLQTATGTYTYEISRIRIVHKDDRTVVVPADHAVLTVSTCYPFQYVGSAPDRYVLIADLVGNQ